jgi:hypothetical protein
LGIKMAETPMAKEIQEENIQINMKLMSYYFMEGDGIVFIYKVIPPSNSLLDVFFIVSFDDGSSEQPWGIGSTPEAALLHAAQEWDRISYTEEERNNNPFRQVLSQFS